jgi:hypothetical protein
MYSKTPICRTPTILDPRTRVPQMMDGPDYPSLFRGFQYQRAYVFGIPDFPMGPNADGSRWLPPVPQMDGSDCIGKSRIAIPLCTSCMTPEIPIFRILTLQDLSPRVHVDGRSRSDREIVFDFNMHESLVSGNPDSRSPTLRDPLPRVPAVWTAQILSGNRGSRFPIATVLHS